MGDEIEEREIVKAIQSRFAPILNQFAVDLARKYPNFHIYVRGYSVGGATPYQGYDLNLFAYFDIPVAEDLEGLVLAIRVKHTDRDPKMNAEVYWDTTADTELEFAEDQWPDATPTIFAEVEFLLPAYYQQIIEAIERRKPLSSLDPSP